MSDNKTFGIHFGCLAPTISSQLKKQKFNFSKDKVKEFEKARQAIILLMFEDILNDSQVEKANSKLFTQIKRHITSKNK